MLSPDAAPWTDLVRQTLERYEEPLLRKVAAKLVRPRSQWPPAELIDRCLQTLANVAVVDRRMQELEAGPRLLLQFIARSRQPRWRLGSLLEMLAATGSEPRPDEVLALLETGFLFPAHAKAGSNKSVHSRISISGWFRAQRRLLALLPSRRSRPLGRGQTGPDSLRCRTGTSCCCP